MDIQSLLAGLIRGLGLTFLAAGLGGLIFDQLIIPADVPALTVARTQLRRWTTMCLLSLLLTTTGELVIRILAMSRAPLAATLVALPSIVSHTHLGVVLIVRLTGLVLAVLLSSVQAAGLRTLCLLVVMGVALTISLTAHAADW